MRTSTLVRVAAVVATTALTGALLSQPAVADDTPLPVAGADTVTLYPGQSAEVDLLANDTGDDLALCRFPGLDAVFEDVPDVIALDESFFGGEPGQVMVQAMPRAKGTHTIDYYVCDHTHLVPATLTVVVREVEPVEVSKLRHKAGRLHVTNHNTKPVVFKFGYSLSTRADGRVRIAPGETVTVRVQRYRIAWVALIGAARKGGSGPGVADLGYVRDIELNGKPLPKPDQPTWEDSASSISTGILVAGR